MREFGKRKHFWSTKNFLNYEYLIVLYKYISAGQAGLLCGIALLVLASSASARVWSRETREAAALGHHHPDRGQWCHYPEHDFKVVLQTINRRSCTITAWLQGLVRLGQGRGLRRRRGGVLRPGGLRLRGGELVTGYWYMTDPWSMSPGEQLRRHGGGLAPGQTARQAGPPPPLPLLRRRGVRQVRDRCKYILYKGVNILCCWHPDGVGHHSHHHHGSCCWCPGGGCVCCSDGLTCAWAHWDCPGHHWLPSSIPTIKIVHKMCGIL